MKDKHPQDSVETKKFKTLKPETKPTVPVCPCGKTPLRCPHPDNCQMEDL